MEHGEPGRHEELRQAAIRVARSSLELTEALIALLEGQPPEAQERPDRCKLRAVKRTAS